MRSHRFRRADHAAIGERAGLEPPGDGFRAAIMKFSMTRRAVLFAFATRSRRPPHDARADFERLDVQRAVGKRSL